MLPRSFRNCWWDSNPHRLLDLGPLFLAGCWPEDALSLLPCGLLQLTASLFTAERESASKVQVMVFYNLVTEVISITFSMSCLFIRNKSLGSAHI